MKKLYEQDVTFDFVTYRKFTLIVNRTRLSVFLTLIFLVGYLLAAMTSGNTSWLLNILGGLAFMFLFFTFYTVMIKRTYTSNKAMQNLAVHYNFFDTYVEQTSNLGKTRFDYTNIYKIVEDKTAIYLLVDRQQGLVIPKKTDDEPFNNFIRNIKK
ncbi:YcxB family protein [Weissella soli]|uniref:YcxB family protein n=1 Tax=Weissella soli TaxID=155866 RepID=UPI0011BB4731|nr:YcxB family protein [Weissella soli]QEA35456.1 YcxB family protein [Weissella soli]